MTYRKSVLPALFLLLTLPAAAQPVKLPAVVVKGSAETDRSFSPSLTAPDIEVARERIERTPGGVDVIDAEEYKTGRVSTLQDALKFSPGVYVQPRFGSEESRLSIRGSGLQRTFHLRGIMLLQDGVPINKADGGGDFQGLEPLATRYIEVQRGANALQYGSTTLGGAINFVTPTGYDAAPFQLRVEGGSFNYLRGQASVAGVEGDADYYLSLSHFSQEGFRDHAEQSTQRLFGDVGYRFSENLESRLYFSGIVTDSELPGTLTKTQLKDDPRQANAFNVMGDQKRDFKRARVATKTTYRFGDSRIEGSLFYTYEHLHHPIFQVLDIEYNDYGAYLRYISESELFDRQNIFTLGFSPQRGTARDDRFANVGGREGARTNRLFQIAETYTLFAENQHYLIPKLALVVGAQYTLARRKLRDRFFDDGVDNSFDRNYWNFSPKLGARYEFTPHNQIYGNISKSFEPPSFTELSGGPNVTQNSAQKAWTFEIGTRGDMQCRSCLPGMTHLGWDLTYYYADVKDELLSLVDPTTGLPLGTVNADDTVHQGVEVGFSLEFLNTLTLHNAYLWNDFRFDDDPVFGDNRLAGIPEHLLNTELVYRHASGFYGGPNFTWSPSEFAVDHANTLFNDNYAVLGFKLGYKPSTLQGFSGFIDIRNILNKRYAADTGVLANANGMDAAAFLPGDGVSAYAGIEWRL
ncbi:MAG: TonB-dependent receptor [Nitrococcus mobilis]|nr:TonB-dependent receptor [Nitrococcus mobilis]